MDNSEATKSKSDTPIIQSTNFASPDADIVIRSSDNVEFRVHNKYLSILSGSFPDQKDLPVLSDEPIVLTEPAKILELFFPFFYRKKLPLFRSLDILELSALAETVEKYQVYHAIEMCYIFMEERKERYPLDVLSYASKHHYIELVNDIGPLTLDLDTEEGFEKLPLETFAAWVRYRSLWEKQVKCIRSEYELFKGCGYRCPNCDMWKTLLQDLLEDLDEGVKDKSEAMDNIEINTYKSKKPCMDVYHRCNTQGSTFVHRHVPKLGYLMTEPRKKYMG